MFIIIGNCGIEYTIKKYGTNWGWHDQRGFGFTHESFEYIVEYMRESNKIGNCY